MRIRLPFVGLFLVSAIVVAADPASMGELISRLGAEDESVRRSAREEIEARGADWTAPDFALLEAALKDGDAERAALARETYEKIGLWPRIGPSLTSAWNRIGRPEPGDKSDHRTKELLWAAANCWRGGGASDREVLALVAMIKEAGGRPDSSMPFSEVLDTRCRPLAAEVAACLRDEGTWGIDAVEALGACGDPRFGEVLKRTWRERFPRNARALRAIADLRVTTAAPEVARLTEDPDWRVRAAAVRSLLGCATDAELPSIRRALRDPVAEVRKVAVRAFAERIPGNLATLIQMTRDPNPDVARAALWEVESNGSAADAVALLPAIHRPEELVRLSAADVILSLRFHKDLRIRFLLREEVTTPARIVNLAKAIAAGIPSIDEVRGQLADPDPAVRCRAIDILLFDARAEFAPQVAALLKDSNAEVRIAAAGFEGQFGPQDLAQEVGELLGDPEERVRLAALLALQLMESPEIGRIVREHATFWTKSTTALALGLIGNRGSSSDAEFVAKHLQDSAIAAANALADLGARDRIPEILETLSHPDSNKPAVWGALFRLGRTEELDAQIAAQSRTRVSDWWYELQRSEGAARASVSLDLLDFGNVLGPIGLYLFDRRRFLDWSEKERREFLRRLRNFRDHPSPQIQAEARVLLLQYGHGNPSEEQSLLEEASGKDAWWYEGKALSAALSAVHEPDAWKAASMVRTLDRDLVTAGDFSKWSSEFGVPLDTGPARSSRTWRKGSKASIRDLAADCMFAGKTFAFYLADGHARLVTESEAMRLWRERLKPK